MLSFIIAFSGCNPNTQTVETEVLKTQAEARRMEFKRKCEEAKHRIIMLEKSKAMKKSKELKEMRQLEENKMIENNKQSIDDLNPFNSSTDEPSFFDDLSADPNMGPSLQEGMSYGRCRWM